MCGRKIGRGSEEERGKWNERKGWGEGKWDKETMRRQGISLGERREDWRNKWNIGRD